MDLTHSDMDFERGKKNPQTIIFVAERFLYNQNPNTGTELFQNGLCILLVLLGVQGTMFSGALVFCHTSQVPGSFVLARKSS